MAVHFEHGTYWPELNDSANHCYWLGKTPVNTRIPEEKNDLEH
jgi:hypothetical protein